MATTTIRYFYGDWDALADHYLREQGWEPLFTDLRGVPGVVEYDPPYVISIREAAQEAAWLYQRLRPRLSPTVHGETDVAFSAIFWGDRPADDMAVLTGYEDPIFTFFTLRPAAVANLLHRFSHLPWSELRDAAARAAWPARERMRYLPEFDDFQGYMQTMQHLLSTAANDGGGLVALC